MRAAAPVACVAQPMPGEWVVRVVAVQTDRACELTDSDSGDNQCATSAGGGGGAEPQHDVHRTLAARVVVCCVHTA